MFLGSKRFVRRLVAERGITYVKDRRHVFVPESAVAEYLAAHTCPYCDGCRVGGPHSAQAGA
ncbi:excisionase family DNA-binding protein [Streptomyces sp. NPDC048196]|uniref:excisionase family DNA-binding protein n=1 Tax=Streptomyces sp. NPDC048196 TaxID=3154712 RepID=UPI0033CF3FC4